MDKGIHKHQFVGFVTSYTQLNVLTLFHLHSFITFYMDSDFNTVVSIPNRFCKLFDLHDDEKIHAFLMKLSNNTHSDFGLSYLTVMNNQSILSVQG